jgi:hypothetical protein
MPALEVETYFYHTGELEFREGEGEQPVAYYGWGAGWLHIKGRCRQRHSLTRSCPVRKMKRPKASAHYKASAKRIGQK